MSPRRARGIAHTSQATAFPLGGIGTGNVSIGARGELRDWELENAPDKGRRNPYSFFAIHVAPQTGESVTRVLEAEMTGRYDRDAGYPFDEVAGLPRLRSATLFGEYPTVDVDFADADLPVTVSLHAFTPLVPLDADASGIPAAILRYRVTNTGAVPAAVTIVGSLSHVAGRGEGPWGMRGTQSVTWRDDGTVRGLDFDVDLEPTDPGYGTLSLTTTDSSTTCKPQWVTSYWPDGARLFWDDLAEDGLLSAEPRLTLEDQPRGLFVERGVVPPAEGYTEAEMLQKLPRVRTGSLGIVHTLAPAETVDFEFALTWSFPNRHRGWRGNIILDDPNYDQTVRNRYAELWPSAWDAACYLHQNLAALESSTDTFVDALYGGTLDPVLVDAIGANIAAVRSTTCFVLQSPVDELGDGPVFAAWEGSFDHVGSCEGTCTHVWSYAQTVAWLFPSLERSARRVEYLLETDDEGAQRFRTNRIFGGSAWYIPPAVDGQLGTFIRLFREWRFSGDDEFLRELWPLAKRSLEYATKQWDSDDDALLAGEMHNTYDIEFHGVEPLANGMHLTALVAGVRLAQHLGEHDLAVVWQERADRVSRAIDDNLWNGEYYQQRIDDVNEWRYQYGDGVLSDQLLGQFHAFVNGLGYLLPSQHVDSALRAIVTHNHRDSLRDVASTQRAYALGQEAGLLLASWPRGGRPRIPFVYSDEVWTGVEHQVAAALLFAGQPELALRVEQSLRARYDGEHRNPWNEIECGNHYARSLASWALLLGATGAQWDAPRGSLAFAPVSGGRCDALFTAGTAWGRVVVRDDTLTLHVLGGQLTLAELRLHDQCLATNVTIGAGHSQTFARPETTTPET